MAKDSLQNVITKLKKEGIEAANAEAEKIKQKAEGEAEDIIINAEMKAKSIIKKAESEQKKIKAQLDLELDRAAKTGLSTFRTAVENALIVPTIDSALSSVLSTPQFMEKVIIEMIKGFASTNFKGADIELILPEELKTQLGNALIAKMKMFTAGGKVNVNYDENISFGFKIGPKNDGFVFDLSDDGFKEIFTRFLSPKFKELFIK